MIIFEATFYVSSIFKEKLSKDLLEKDKASN